MKQRLDDLTCPACGGEYMHHTGVRMFDREEDEGRCIRTHVSKGHVKTTVVENTRDNPSLRRDGVAIRFECEDCSVVSELCYAQHKGATLVGWRTVGRCRPAGFVTKKDIARIGREARVAAMRGAEQWRASQGNVAS